MGERRMERRERDLSEGGKTLQSLFSEVPLNKFNHNEGACIIELLESLHPKVGDMPTFFPFVMWPSGIGRHPLLLLHQVGCRRNDCRRQSRCRHRRR